MQVEGGRGSGFRNLQSLGPIDLLQALFEVTWPAQGVLTRRQSTADSFGGRLRPAFRRGLVFGLKTMKARAHQLVKSYRDYWKDRCHGGNSSISNILWRPEKTGAGELTSHVHVSQSKGAPASNRSSGGVWPLSHHLRKQVTLTKRSLDSRDAGYIENAAFGWPAIGRRSKQMP